MNLGQQYRIMNQITATERAISEAMDYFHEEDDDQEKKELRGIILEMKAEIRELNACLVGKANYNDMPFHG